ncbi:hypothetical protein FRACYDRAFT_249444 [Fragilariopsis cylindrus CCMP1102]|uniref:Cyclic nucleotide-binding domain-containing protein n=1 Tax=Fragilariopsis cylindrus CCMP1102 TaxID=635003 RepID=A0A1E7ERL6_9STRA|nr:hypothetical protein FRACYDRAFT_249444 [Fragilariopsis cylindrus CCMP1102]|eukprot:OEU08552.1 hypothetical protein FRACYDRAFT_249444 [Fragilariopsis cylindrus CCMP1102]
MVSIMSRHASRTFLSSSRLFRTKSNSAVDGSIRRRSALFLHRQHNSNSISISCYCRRQIIICAHNDGRRISTGTLILRSKKNSSISTGISRSRTAATPVRSIDKVSNSRCTSSSSPSSSSSQSGLTSQPSSASSSVLPLWIVNHPSSIAIVPILGNLAYASLAGGFLCNDLLSLRLLLISGYSGLVTYHALRPTPLRIPLRWSAFFVLVNTTMAVMLLMDRLPPTLTKEEEELHIEHFAPLRRKQFKALMDIAQTVIYPPGTVLTTANQPCTQLYFIVKGTAIMTNSKGEHISKLQRGGFPNCMSFQRSGWDAVVRNTTPNGNCAYGTIRVSNNNDDNDNEGVECLVWKDDELLALLDDGGDGGGDNNNNDGYGGDIRLRFDHVVIEAVIRRLLVDSEGANVTDYIRVISKGWAADKAVHLQKFQSMTRVSKD